MANILKYRSINLIIFYYCIYFEFLDTIGLLSGTLCIRIKDSRFYFIFLSYFYFIFYLFSILDLGLGVNMTSHVTLNIVKDSRTMMSSYILIAYNTHSL